MSQQKYTHAQGRRRLSRACNSSTTTYCGFLFDDNEGSDFDNSSADETEAEDEEYNPAQVDATFDKMKGDKDWLGRRVCKTFGEQGDFDGIIYAIDDDEDNAGYKLYMVHYFEDPNDGESMWPEEVNRYTTIFFMRENQFI